MITRAMIRAALRLARRGRLDIEAWVRSLASEYLAVQTKLENMVLASFLAGDFKTAQKRQRQLRKMRAELQALDKRTKLQTRRIARESYRLGERSIATGTGERDLASQPKLRRDAIQIIEDNLNNRLGEATKTVGRRLDDIFRREGLRAAAEGLYGEQENLIKATGAYRDRLMREGITAFVDRQGKKWDLHTYAEMHIRTNVTDALAMGARSALAARELDLIRIVSGETACAKCEPFVEGSPWSLTGRSKKHKKLPEDPAYHPNCDCVILPDETAIADREKFRELQAA